jgi:Uma2 family endonuclease
MSLQLKTRYTLQEYLDLEKSTEVRHEYLDGEVFAMGGASWPHVVIVSNIVRYLGNQLEGRGCQVTSNDLRVKVPGTGLYTYPDVTVVCGKPQFEQPGDSLLNPVVVAEVLSDSTEAYDRGKKFEHYRSIDSLTDYVLVSQTEVLVEHYSRQPDGRWLYTAANKTTDSLSITGVGCVLNLAEVYDNVEGLAARSA